MSYTYTCNFDVLNSPEPPEALMERLSGSQSVEERLDWMETWLKADVPLLLDADWEITKYESPRSAERALARHLGFAFEREIDIVGWVFCRKIPGMTLFETDTNHRRECLYFAQSVDWVCNADVSHEVRLAVAETLSQADEESFYGIWAKVRADLEIGQTQVQKALNYFEKEGAIEKSGRDKTGGTIYQNINLEEYVSQYGDSQIPAPAMAPSIPTI